MGIHYRLPAPRLVAQGGPVTRALAVMTAADPKLARIRTLRRSIAARIEADIALLDALSGDVDFEHSGDDEPGNDDEPSLGSINPSFGTLCWEGGGHIVRFDGLDQPGWAAGSSNDGELGDDNGIADESGEAEQFGWSRHNEGGAA